jgi:hypothetical protein
MAVAAVAPATAEALVAVDGARLRVELGGPNEQGAHTNAQIQPLSGGGVIVSFHGSVLQQDRTAGSGCQEVAVSNAGDIPFGFPGTSDPEFAATCDMTGVRVIEGELDNLGVPRQGWLSSAVHVPTNVRTSGFSPPASPAYNLIVTGNGGDRITGGPDRDEIHPGGAPYKGQELFPPSGDPALDDPARNVLDGNGGDDIFVLTNAPNFDVANGGAGTDLASYADRFPIGAPGADGVTVTLDGQRNDGDPSIDPPDSSVGEGDNIGTDVENVTGTKRDDTLTGNGLANVLLGDEGVDTLTGAAGQDRLLAREPASAGSGTADVLSCGPPAPPPPRPPPGRRSSRGLTLIGLFAPASGIDTLEADLADPRPADCEELVDMAVDEPAPIRFPSSARRARRNRLLVRLTCPRAAQRRCRGRLRLAGRRRSGSTAARFSIPSGGKRTVRLELTRAAAAATAQRRVVARILSSETGLRGPVNRVALLRVRG